jgi:predicted metal-dependent phosphotriesterase family hydrolase
MVKTAACEDFPPKRKTVSDALDLGHDKSAEAARQSVMKLPVEEPKCHTFTFEVIPQDFIAKLRRVGSMEGHDAAANCLVTFLEATT